jgi:hypothetical protein
MTIREVIETRTDVSNLANDEIIEMAYGIKYFCPLSAGMSRDDAIWWNDVQQSFVNRLDAITSAPTQPTRKPVESVKCSCGHTVPKNLVMSTSLGTSCQDCYDKMSV